jgi:zinc transport system ATP-binding protein
VTEPTWTPSDVDPVLEVSGVTFSYGERPVLEGVSLDISSGEFVALTGGNGSGKSTLIKVALGLLAPQRGTVTVFGKPLEELEDRWRLGYVPQRARVEADLPATVEEIVRTGRLPNGRWWRRAKGEDQDAVDHALEIAGLEDLRSKRMSGLSGGQQQRAFVARALASLPHLLVLDEPTAGIDAEAQERFRETLVHHVRVHHGAVLLVTHALEPVASDVDRVLVMAKGVLA